MFETDTGFFETDTGFFETDTGFLRQSLTHLDTGGLGQKNVFKERHRVFETDTGRVFEPDTGCLGQTPSRVTFFFDFSPLILDLN